MEEDVLAVLEPTNDLDVADRVALDEVGEELGEAFPAVPHRCRVLGVALSGVLVDRFYVVSVPDSLYVEGLGVFESRTHRYSFAVLVVLGQSPSSVPLGEGSWLSEHGREWTNADPAGRFRESSPSPATSRRRHRTRPTRTGFGQSVVAASLRCASHGRIVGCARTASGRAVPGHNVHVHRMFRNIHRDLWFPC